MTENSLGCFVSYFCSIQNNNTTMLINSEITKKLNNIIKKFNPDLLVIPCRLEQKFINKDFYKKKNFFDFSVLKIKKF